MKSAIKNIQSCVFSFCCFIPGMLANSFQYTGNPGENAEQEKSRGREEKEGEASG
jgi:hypothetical protein